MFVLPEEILDLFKIRILFHSPRNDQILICYVMLQLSQCQDRMTEQEKMLEDPNDETRVRFLEGKDMNPAELKDKMQEVCV